MAPAVLPPATHGGIHTPRVPLKHSKSDTHFMLKQKNAPLTITAPLAPMPSTDTPFPTSKEIALAFTLPPFSFHTISLAPFSFPSDLPLLAPFEEHHQFANRQHRRRYRLLKSALKTAQRSLKQLQHAAAIAAPLRWQKQHATAAEAFHKEFTARLSWGQHDPNDEERTVELPVDQQQPDSPFPSINLYISHWPRMTIAAAVRDFYRRQEERTADYRALLELKHQWEWCELHYYFFRAVQGMRRNFGIDNTPHSRWWGILAKLRKENEPDVPVDHMFWTPEMDRRRKEEQFQTLKKIAGYLESVGLDFPLSFCPGGSTVRDYFGEDAGKGWCSNQDVRKMFQRRSDAKVWKDPDMVERIRRETLEMLAAESLAEYFEGHPVGTEEEADVSTVGGSTSSESENPAKAGSAGSGRSLGGDGAVTTRTQSPKLDERTTCCGALPHNGKAPSLGSAPSVAASEPVLANASSSNARRQYGGFRNPRGAWPLGLRA